MKALLMQYELMPLDLMKNTIISVTSCLLSWKHTSFMHIRLIITFFLTSCYMLEIYDIYMMFSKGK